MMEIKLKTEEYNKMEDGKWELKEKRISILNEEQYEIISDVCYIDGKVAKEINKYDDSNRLVQKILIDKKGMKKHIKTFVFPN